MYNNTIPNKIYNPYGNNGYLNPFVQPQGIYPQPQQLPQSMQQPMQQPQQQGGFNVMPVANADEAKAVQTPFDGSILILPNINNGKIYTKQLNMNTGSAIFNEYSISTPVAVAQQPTNANTVATPTTVYATQKELDDLRQELLDKLNALNNIQQVADVVNEKPLFANNNKANKKDTATTKE